MEKGLDFPENGKRKMENGKSRFESWQVDIYFFDKNKFLLKDHRGLKYKNFQA